MLVSPSTFISIAYHVRHATPHQAIAKLDHNRNDTKSETVSVVPARIDRVTDNEPASTFLVCAFDKGCAGSVFSRTGLLSLSFRDAVFFQESLGKDSYVWRAILEVFTQN